MTEFSVSFINGLMLGIEHVNGQELDDDLKFIVVVDFFVLRFTLSRWKAE